MRHHTAAALSDSSGWHYASVHPRRGGYPLGYCADHAPHPTADEARACYRRWQRDHVEAHGTCHWTSCDVRGCEDPARKAWHVRGDGYLLVVLCAGHDNREHATAALGLSGDLAGDSWQS